MIYKNYLYNKSVELLFDEFKHAYFYEGKKIPSVTTILGIINKPALISWAANMAAESFKEAVQAGVIYDELQLQEIYNNLRTAHRKKKTDAADIGSFTHKWVEDWIKGKKPEPPVNENLRESTERFLKWQKEHSVKFLSSEQVIYSKKYGYTGTLDFICRYEDKLILGDLKTSNGVWPEMWLQTAAYRQAREEEFPKEKYAGQAIIRIGKDGTFDFQEEEKDFDKHIAAFLAAKSLYETIKEMEDNAKR